MQFLVDVLILLLFVVSVTSNVIDVRRNITCLSLIYKFNADRNLNKTIEEEYQYLGYKWHSVTQRYIRKGDVSLMSHALPTTCNKIINQNTEANELRINRSIILTALNFPQQIVLSVVNNTVLLHNYYADLLSIFITKFNVNVHIIRTKDNVFGIFKDNKWSGLIGDLINGTANVSVGICPSRQRLNYVKVSPALYTLQLDLVYKKLQHHKLQYMFFLKPYDNTTWLCIFTVNLIIILIIIFSKYGVKAKSGASFLSDQTNEFHLCWPIVTQGYSSFLSITSVKLCLEIYFLFSIVMLIGYTSVLTSLLANNKIKIPFYSVEDMLENTNYSLVISGGSFIEEHVEKIPFQDRIVRVKNTLEGIDVAFTTDSAYAITNIDRRRFINKNCSFGVAERHLTRDIIALGYSKQFAYIEYFNQKIVKLKEIGILSHMYIRYFGELNTCPNEVFYPGSLGHAVGALIVIVCAILISVICLVVELLWNWFNNLK